MKKASGTLSNVSKSFFGRLVASEALVIKTTNLAISLKKVSADDVKGLGMEEGPSKFKLPSSLGNMGGGNINAKVRKLEDLIAIFEKKEITCFTKKGCTSN